MATDDLGRPELGAAIKARIAEAFAVLPERKRGAVLAIADTETKEVRLHLAAKIGDQWKVAAGGGWVIKEKRPAGWVGVEWAW